MDGAGNPSVGAFCQLPSLFCVSRPFSVAAQMRRRHPSGDGKSWRHIALAEGAVAAHLTGLQAPNALAAGANPQAIGTAGKGINVGMGKAFGPLQTIGTGAIKIRQATGKARPDSLWAQPSATLAQNCAGQNSLGYPSG